MTYHFCDATNGLLVFDYGLNLRYNIDGEPKGVLPPIKALRA
jgi:hypothetical protein